MSVAAWIGQRRGAIKFRAHQLGTQVGKFEESGSS